MKRKNYNLVMIVLAGSLLCDTIGYAQIQDVKSQSAISDFQEKFKEFTRWIEERFGKLKNTIHNLRPSVQQKQMKEKADESKAMMHRRMQKSELDQTEANRQLQSARDNMDILQRQQRLIMPGVPGR